jgi:hypothetical protein
MRIKVTGIPPLLTREAPAILREELMLARDQVGGETRKAVVEAIHTSKPREPVDEGTMVAGISFVPVTGQLKGRVAPHPATETVALVQELGRRPGQPGPPLQPIERWARRRLGLSGSALARAARAIARKIHLKGFPGRGFFARARKIRTLHQKAIALVRAAIRRFARRTT